VGLRDDQRKAYADYGTADDADSLKSRQIGNKGL
jgi:hypothetical protein